MKIDHKSKRSTRPDTKEITSFKKVSHFNNEYRLNERRLTEGGLSARGFIVPIPNQSLRKRLKSDPTDHQTDLGGRYI